MSGRVHKSVINAEVNLLFYFLSLFLAFFSRKIFIDNLSADFIGLTGTLGNILGYLNLAELGIGSCVSFFLYKPVQAGDRIKIGQILSVLGYLYRCIGFAMLGAGVVLSLFFPLMFGGEKLGMSIIYFTFYSFLGSSLISYFINYRQILLQADQKNYLVAVYFQSAGLVKTAVQIFLAYRYHNLYVWVAIEFMFGVFACIVLNRKIDKEYPWLRTDKASGRRLLSQYPEILANTRQIFIHKIKDFVLSKSDELFIFAFISLKMVAYYGNYIMITSKITLLFTSVLDSVNAGVGNLVAEGRKDNMMKVFWELMTIRHFVAGVLCFSIYYGMEPFISLWLGNKFILDHDILVMLVTYIYMINSRGVVDIFNHSHGLYADVWSAWAELAINITITIVGGWMYGITGILAGKIVSVFAIVIFWKPYYLFTAGLKLPVTQYWNGAVRYYVVFGVAFAAGTVLEQFIPINPYEGYIQWIGYSVTCLAIFLAVEIAGLLLFAKGARDCIGRIKVFKK